MRKAFAISVLLILFINTGAAAIAGPTQDGGGSAENPYLVTNSVTYGEFLNVEFECVEGDCYDNLIEEEVSDYVIAVKQNGELISLSRDVNMQYDENEGKFHYDFSTTDYLKFDDPDKESNSLTAGEVKFEFLAKTDATDDYEDMTKISEGTATVEPWGDMNPHRGKYLYIKANQNSDTLYMYILSNEKWSPKEVDDSDFDQGDAVVEEVDTEGWTPSSSKCAINFDKNAVNLASLGTSKLPDAEYKKSCEENNKNPKTLVENGFENNYVPTENMVEEFENLDTATPLHGVNIELSNPDEELARGNETNGDGPYWFVCREGNDGKTIDTSFGEAEELYTCNEENGKWEPDEGQSEQNTDSTDPMDERLEDTLGNQEPAPTTGEDTDRTDTERLDFGDVYFWSTEMERSPLNNEVDESKEPRYEYTMDGQTMEGFFVSNGQVERTLQVLRLKDEYSTESNPGSLEENEFIRNEETVTGDDIYLKFPEESHAWGPEQEGIYNIAPEGSKYKLRVYEGDSTDGEEPIRSTTFTIIPSSESSGQNGGSDGEENPTLDLDVAAEEMTEFSWKKYCANNQDDIGEDGINTDDGISASEAATCIEPSWGADPDEETPHNPDVTHGELVKDFCEPYYEYDSDATKCEVS